VVGLFLWRLLLAGMKRGLLACILLGAMFTSIYFRALAILDTQRPDFWSRIPAASDDAEFEVKFGSFFGFCFGAIVGVLFWLLWVGVKRYQRERSRAAIS